MTRSAGPVFWYSSGRALTAASVRRWRFWGDSTDDDGDIAVVIVVVVVVVVVVGGCSGVLGVLAALVRGFLLLSLLSSGEPGAQ
jgi:hypothetical protein